MASNAAILKDLRMWEVVALALGFSITAFAVFARLYTKIRLTKTMKGEDYFSLLAWLSFQVYIALAIVIGRHPGSDEHVAYLSVVENNIYCPVIVLVKISILLQYITLFVVHRGTVFHYFVHVLIWSNVVYYVIISFLYNLECNPREKMWNPAIPGHCFAKTQTGVASGAMNMALDFSIFVLPLPVIYSLQMSWAMKLRFLAVFGVGLLACITSIIRFVYSLELDHADERSATYQFYTDKTGLWAFAEIAIGIIVGCLPVLPRFFKQFTSFASLSLPKVKLLASKENYGSSWRRFFRKSSSRLPSTSSKEPMSPWPQRFFGSSDKSSGANTVAPHHIKTLNLTRCSLEVAEVSIPRPPSPALEKERAVRKSGEFVDDWTYANANDDIEKAVPRIGTHRELMEKRKEGL